MKTINLLLKNAFRSAKRNVYQIVGLSVLIFLVAVMFSLLSFSGSTITGGRNTLNSNSNLRDVVVDIHTDKMYIDGTGYNLDSTTQEVYQEYIINEIANEQNLNWTRTEGRTFSDISNGNQSLLIKTVTKFGNSNVNYDSPSSLSNTVDKIVITSGSDFSSDPNVAIHQTILQKNFAEANGIKIGDIVRFSSDTFSTDEYKSQLLVTKDPTIAKNLEQDLNGGSWSENIEKTRYANADWFEVVGFGASADFAAPIIDLTTTIPNVKKDLIAYMSPQTMGFTKFANQTVTKDGTSEVVTLKPLLTFTAGDARLTVLSMNDQEIYYSLKAKDGSSIDVNKIKDEFQKKSGLKTPIDFIYKTGDSNYNFSQRIDLFTSVSSIFNAIFTVLLLIIVSIAVFVIILITKKYVESISKQLGCLKALGYKKREIVNNFIALPIISSLIGCLSGYLISIGLCKYILYEFNLYFNVTFQGVSFNIWSFLSSVFAATLLMIMLSYIAAYIIIRHSALRLLQGDAVGQSSKFSRGLKKLNHSKTFDGRLRGALISSSFGKISALTLTMLLSTILMTSSIVAPKIMKDNTKKSFEGLNYKNEVDYNAPLWNNPLSFIRTYNPNYDGTSDGDSDIQTYGFNDGKNKDYLNNVNMDNYNSKSKSIVSLPYTSDGKQIDIDRVLNDVLQNKISNFYYSFDKADSTLGTAWSKMAFLGWKTLPISYLKNLNDVKVTDITGMVLGSLSKQWPEYQSILDDTKLIGANDETLTDDSKDAFYEVFRKFYVKLSNGLPLKYVDPSGLFTKDTWNDNKNAIKGLCSNNIYNYLVSLNNASDYHNDLAINTNDTSSTFDFYYNGEKVDLSQSSSLNKNITRDEKDSLTIQLLRWFANTVYKKMGTVLLETSFYRSPYYVQQKMTDAYLNGTNYSLSFNITPYDENNDDIGTLVNGFFKQKNGEENSLKIYGVKENQKTVDLETDYSKLIRNSDDDSIPIIVNQTVLKKTGYKIGDTIDINYLKDQLTDEQGNAAELLNKTEASTLTASSDDGLFRTSDGKLGTYVGISPDKQPVYNFLPESAVTYYSRNDHSYVSDDGMLLKNIDSCIISGSKISGTSALDSTSIHDATINVANGSVTKKSQNINQKFKIVGSQSSYGKPLAWISNDEANKLLGYDKTEEYLYHNFFYQQYANVINGKNDTADFGNYKLYNENSTVTDDESNYNKYHKANDIDTLEKLKLDVANNVEGAANVLKLFNRLYPIFNYKMSTDSANYDLDQAIPTDNLYGDWSSVGMNGGDTAGDKDGNGKVYYSGFGSSTIGTLYPINQAREILEQITSIVNMLIIILLTIAFILSLTIIILTTSIIIRENNQFISTMKVLGYSNSYIVRQIVSIYIFGIVVAFFVGFVLAWFGVQYAGDILAQQSSWVLPIDFYYWYPFASLGVLSLIYFASTMIAWKNIQKLHPLAALQMDK